MSGLMFVFMSQLRPARSAISGRDVQLTADNIASFLAGELSSAAKLPLIQQDRTEDHLLIGTPDSVKFNAVVRTGFGKTGLREVTYRLTKRDDSAFELNRLTRMRRFNAVSDSVVQTSEVLYGSMSSLTFHYLLKNVDGTYSWQRSFSNTNELPAAVEIIVQIDNHGKGAGTGDVIATITQ